MWMRQIEQKTNRQIKMIGEVAQTKWNVIEKNTCTGFTVIHAYRTSGGNVGLKVGVPIWEE